MGYADGTEPISNSADIIDSREVIARIDFLESVQEDGENEIGPGLDEAERAELVALTALAEEAEGYAADWHYGEQIISDDYFATYAKQLAEDIGAVNSDANVAWPNKHIDWEAAADELKNGDYSEVDFDGVTYWVR